MKDTAVKKMFETIAGGYDFQNSFLSLGIDIYWRKILARLLDPPRNGVVLDVAVGTGEVALAICRRHPATRPGKVFPAGSCFRPETADCCRCKAVQSMRSPFPSASATSKKNQRYCRNSSGSSKPAVSC
jgi:demethylmenaquinone methyltransferase/2-methoxy-6-polyprenyl-1,4-benzoquinol methylase